MCRRRRSKDTHDPVNPPTPTERAEAIIAKRAWCRLILCVALHACMDAQARTFPESVPVIRQCRDQHSMLDLRLRPAGFDVFLNEMVMAGPRSESDPPCQPTRAGGPNGYQPHQAERLRPAPRTDGSWAAPPCGSPFSESRSFPLRQARLARARVPHQPGIKYDGSEHRDDHNTAAKADEARRRMPAVREPKLQDCHQHRDGEDIDVRQRPMASMAGNRRVRATRKRF